MARYAIGDVQGCFDELQALVARIGFDPAHDRLWFVGDLVNRGPKSLEVLRWVRGLGEAAVVVLGNHDLHLACVHAGAARPRSDDTLGALLAAPDADALLEWLRARPLFHREGRHAMVHAGLLPQWSLERAAALAREVEVALTGDGYRDFLGALYGNEPRAWDDALDGQDRLRIVVNAMTRLRFCTPQGAMAIEAKGATAPPGHVPWFETRPADEDVAIVCGHWSTLGLKLAPRLAALDTGCVWGGALTALRLEDRALYQVPSPGYQAPGGD